MRRFPYVFLALALSACSTYPTGPYQKADANRKLCNSTGELAAMAYQGKVDGRPSLEWMLADIAKGTTNMSAQFKSISEVAIQRGYAANSRSDAKMAGWSYCMDSLRT